MYSQSFQTVNLRALCNISLVFHTMLNHHLIYELYICSAGRATPTKIRAWLCCADVHTQGRSSPCCNVEPDRTNTVREQTFLL